MSKKKKNLQIKTNQIGNTQKSRDPNHNWCKKLELHQAARTIATFSLSRLAEAAGLGIG